MSRGSMYGRKAGVALAAILLPLILASVPASATGTTWSAKKLPLPSGAATKDQYASLAAVSCPSGSCVAIGGYDTKNTLQGLIETRTSNEWSGAEAPAIPGGSSGSLDQVACSSTGNCVALGAGSSELLVESGGAWSPVDVAEPSGGSDLQLDVVTCSSSGCAVAGTYYDSSDDSQWTVVTGSGSTWTAAAVTLPTDLPSGYSLEVKAIGCHSDGACESVGDYNLTPGPGPEDSTSEPIIVTGSVADGWTAVASRLPANAEKYKYADSYPEDQLVGVSCAPSGGSCVAVGKYEDTTSAIQGLIMDGMSPIESPVPDDGTFSYPSSGLTGVYCGSATSCNIVGTYLNSSDSTDGAVISGSGKTWSVTSAPVSLPPNASPSTPAVVLREISCGSASLCAVIGQYTDSSGNTHSMLLSGSASTWAAQEAEAPIPNDGEIYMGGVSCWSHGCVAVGSYQISSDGNTEALAETLS
jgi:hypothetical protein